MNTKVLKDFFGLLLLITLLVVFAINQTKKPAPKGPVKTISLSELF